MRIEKDHGLNGTDLKKNAIAHHAKELTGKKWPAVLSSYMSTDNLPDEYRAIDIYVRGIRQQLLEEIGDEPTQLQMLVLDGICETLILSKYITTYISKDFDLFGSDKLGNDVVSDVVSKGFSGLQTLLDKKIKQFRDMVEVNRADEEHDAYLSAIMGKKAGTTKGKTGR